MTFSDRLYIFRKVFFQGFKRSLKMLLFFIITISLLIAFSKKFAALSESAIEQNKAPSPLKDIPR